MLRRIIGFTIVICAGVSCSRDESASAHPREDAHARRDGVAPRPAVIAPLAQPYKVVGPGTGTVTGTVDFDGNFPLDSVVRPTSDVTACGNSLAVRTVTHTGTKVVGAVVWLTDIRSGKAFPVVRRFELTNNNCQLDPYVQVIMTNSTLNVSNDDRALHTNRFINVATGDYAAIAPFNDDGEVVPLDKLKEPAEIEIVCEEHPWTHAWLAVLDHPYFATTSNAGTFTIEGIPPGKYHIRAWQPALGYSDDSVTVAAGQASNVAFHIRANAPRTIPTTPVARPESAGTLSVPSASSTSPEGPDAPPPAPQSTPAASKTSSSTPAAPPPTPPPQRR